MISRSSLEYFLESKQTLSYRMGCICLPCGPLAMPSYLAL